MCIVNSHFGRFSFLVGSLCRPCAGGFLLAPVAGHNCVRPTKWKKGIFFHPVAYLLAPHFVPNFCAFSHRDCIDMKWRMAGILRRGGFEWAQPIPIECVRGERVQRQIKEICGNHVRLRRTQMKETAKTMVRLKEAILSHNLYYCVHGNGHADIIRPIPRRAFFRAFGRLPASPGRCRCCFGVTV